MDVLCWYYLSPKYNILSIIKERVGAELFNVPYPGDVVIIDPLAMEGLSTKVVAPGAYLVEEVYPNEKRPDQTYDYIKHGSFYRMDAVQVADVKPLFTVLKSTFNDFTFNVYTDIDDDGFIKRELSVMNLKTGEVTFIDVE